MAEKYGEIPKRFTKKWWEYFWDYYKIHTFVILFIAIVVISTVYSVVTAPEYDFNVVYSGKDNMPVEQVEMLKEKLSLFVTDSDGDGKDGVEIRQNTYIEGLDDASVAQTMIMRMQLEATDQDSIVYLINEANLCYMIDAPEMERVFKPVEEWLENETQEDKLYKFNGQAYAVKVNESKILAECGILSDDLYLAVRDYLVEQDDEMKEKIADAINIANAIME